jgi:uncharacterized protein
MLENIRAHTIMVGKIAFLIASGLHRSGIDVSVKEATVGALLHDIGKTPALKSGENHAETGMRICLENNLDEIAPIVREHVRLKNYDLDGMYCEKEIVFYSDKRVNHDQIVSLNERMDYIIERYAFGKEDLCEAIRKNFLLCTKVEEKLFRKLAFRPESLPFIVESEGPDFLSLDA